MGSTSRCRPVWLAYDFVAALSDIGVVQQGGDTTARVNFTFPDTGYRDTASAPVVQSQNTVLLKAGVERWTGPTQSAGSNHAHAFEVTATTPGKYPVRLETPLGTLITTSEFTLPAPF